MEPSHGELLSRYEITTILNERHLKIPSIDQLPYDELLRIYKTFAVPLEQRECKRPIDTREPQPEPYEMSPTKKVYSQDVLAQTIILNDHLKTRSDPHLLQKQKYLKLSYNTISLMATKRQSSISIHGVEEASPVKRRPVHWQ